MKYKYDLERAKTKFNEFWNMENHDRPLIAVTAPREGYIPKEIKTPERLIDRWTDTEYIIKCSRRNFESTYFGGEALPIMNPNLGPDVFGAFLGCELEFGEQTSWAKNIIDDWHNFSQPIFSKNNKCWKKIVEITEAACKDSNGDYLVGITDLHPGADGIVSLRGPENLCYDLIDEPDFVKKTNFQIFRIYKEVYNELYRLISKYQKGTTNWMGIWHPEKWYVTSTDFICMISQDMFKEFILPELLLEIDFLDASIFHLDGPGALKHLDTLLEIPKLKGIQWVYGAGQPSASHWIPVLKKIQEANKLIQVNIQPEEIEILMENLKPEGVMYITHCKTEQDAKDLIRKVESF